MTIFFTKYHGTGNDFILMDNRRENIKLTTEEISFLCNRRLGIGADGLIYIMPSKKHDFEMKYFNANGLEGSMCGNGGRCITGFAYHLGIISKNAHFKAIDGEHKSIVHSSSANELYIEFSILDVEVSAQTESLQFINTGSPHYIEIVDNIESLDVKEKGKELRWDKRFQPEGTNVNFVEIEKDVLHVKTFERGVEDITLSCGTGVTAAAISVDLQSKVSRNKYNIKTPGGDLKITFERKNQVYKNIQLSGPVVKVFEGIINL